MRKRYWVLLAIMVFGGAGNLIGGTETPGRAAVDPADAPAVERADVPAAPRFDATMFVSASSLNLLMEPSAVGRVIPGLSRNSRVLAGERRSGWVVVSALGQVGLVRQHLAGVPWRLGGAPRSANDRDLKSRLNVSRDKPHHASVGR